MKILIIDNGTSYLTQLEKLVSGHTSQVAKYSEISTVDPDSFDAIVLSGGHNFSVEGNDERLGQELNLVKNSNKPIFGICYGFEIISHAFGAKLELMQKSEKGIVDIKVVLPDEVFLNIKQFQVFENHRYVVKELPADIDVLARSRDGIEAFKHKTLPIYAVQFHPEMFVDKSCGDEIFNNFLLSIQY